MKKKDPFVNYTTEQVFTSEALLYVIQIGEKVFEDGNGQWFFLKRPATVYYNRILKQIQKQIYKGTDKERRKAKAMLLDFKILPLRMH